MSKSSHHLLFPFQQRTGGIERRLYRSIEARQVESLDRKPARRVRRTALAVRAQADQVIPVEGQTAGLATGAVAAVEAAAAVEEVAAAAATATVGAAAAVVAAKAAMVEAMEVAAAAVVGAVVTAGAAVEAAAATVVVATAAETAAGRSKSLRETVTPLQRHRSELSARSLAFPTDQASMPLVLHTSDNKKGRPKPPFPCTKIRSA
jgi:hypothetical protein